MNIGWKIKELRNSKNITLKQLSEDSGLSVGFLSQLERGLTSIAVDSLENLAKILGVNLSFFFNVENRQDRKVLKSYERPVLNMQEGGFISYSLCQNLEDKAFVPKLVNVFPHKTDEQVALYKHSGEEFIYVLEGILTLYIDNNMYDLYPGDSIYLDSSEVHNWANNTNKLVKILTVNSPNYFRGEKNDK
ncbi:XRE family transcriptional regulator [Clostridium sp.]|uniref:helix-turn-helix domain-containing protein n=1 Tax=Clostridium sp. TaxID=1506 RepID=UPI002FC86F5C